MRTPIIKNGGFLHITKLNISDTLKTNKSNTLKRLRKTKVIY